MDLALKMRPSHAGDYGWKAISSADAETKKRKLSAELANGRLAMTLGHRWMIQNAFVV